MIEIWLNVLLTKERPMIEYYSALAYMTDAAHLLLLSLLVVLYAVKFTRLVPVH